MSKENSSKHTQSSVLGSSMSVLTYPELLLSALLAKVPSREVESATLDSEDEGWTVQVTVKPSTLYPKGLCLILLVTQSSNSEEPKAMSSGDTSTTPYFVPSIHHPKLCVVCSQRLKDHSPALTYEGGPVTLQCPVTST